MIARILNPGPSLASYHPGDADLTIAVNRAGLIPHRFDVWAALDYPLVRDNAAKVKGCPLWLTRRQTWKDIGTRCQFPAAFVEDIRLMSADAPKWDIKTMTCAMAYAFTQGAERIELYGCDWSGTADYDGTEAGEDRSDKRWLTEAAQVGALMLWMHDRGVEVERFIPCNRSS